MNKLNKDLILIISKYVGFYSGIDFEITFFENKNNIDWGNIAINPKIPMSFIEKHINEMNFHLLSRNTSLPLEFIKKYSDRLNWWYLSRNINITCDLFELHLDQLDWSSISSNANIPISFLEKHIDKVDWISISGVGSDLSFFEKHIDKLIWYNISMNLNIPIDFIEKHMSKNPEIIKSVGWDFISRRKDLSLQFCQKYGMYLNWYYLITRRKIPFSFIEKNYKLFSESLLSINEIVPNHYNHLALVDFLLTV